MKKSRKDLGTFKVYVGIDMNKLREEIKNMSEEEFHDAFFDDRPLPKGWISIEEYLPYMDAGDLFTGGTRYKVKNNDNVEFESLVMDHHMWYHDAKVVGITHWWNN